MPITPLTTRTVRRPADVVEAVNAVIDAVGTVSGDVGESLEDLETRASSLEESSTELAARADDLETDTGALDGRVTSTEAAAIALGTRATALEFLPAVVNVAAYSATGNGSSSDSTAISNAHAAAVSAGKPLYFPPGTYRTSVNHTLTAGIWASPGAVLKPDNATTITISGVIHVPRTQQIFSLVSGGVISLGRAHDYPLGWFGGHADGVADSSQENARAMAWAISSAQAAGGGIIAAEPGTYIFRNIAGTYATGFYCPAHSNIIIRGAGRDATTLRWSVTSGGAPQHLLWFDGGDHITIEDMTIDGGDLGITLGGLLSLVRLSGPVHAKVRRARITGHANSAACHSQFGEHHLYEDVEFVPSYVAATNTTLAQHTGIRLGEVSGFTGIRHVTVRQCKFWNHSVGITGVTNTPASAVTNLVEDVLIEHSYFDGMWWNGPTRYGRSLSGTMTFGTDGGGTYCLDSGAAWPTPSAFTPVRLNKLIMGSFTPTAVSGNFVTSSGGAFSAFSPADYDDRLYYFQSSDGKRAVVFGKASNTDVRIEGWTIATTGAPTSPPTGMTLKLYKAVIGAVNGTGTSTGTKLYLYTYWFDKDGVQVADASITTGNGYESVELLGNALSVLNYAGMHFEYGTRRIVARKNQVLRSWADAISFYGSDCDVDDNDIRDGQDQGVTSNLHPYLATGRNVVRNNRIHHQGTNAITALEDAHVHHNRCTATGWTNQANLQWLGDIVAIHGLIESNYCDGMSRPRARHGIVISSGAYSLTVRNNICKRHDSAAISSGNDHVPCGIKEVWQAVYGYTSYGARIEDNDCTEEETPYSQVTETVGGATSVGFATRIPVVTGGDGNRVLLTIAGTVTPGAHYDLRIKMTVGGARGTAEWQYSLDGGATYNGVGTVTSGTPSAIGSTGATIAFAVGTYTLDVVYTCPIANGGGYYDYKGEGPPALMAAKGSIYRRTDGGAGTCFYVQEGDEDDTGGWDGK